MNNIYKIGEIVEINDFEGVLIGIDKSIFEEEIFEIFIFVDGLIRKFKRLGEVFQEIGKGFASFAFPLIRKVYPPAIVNNLVSIQPMALSKGLIFFNDIEQNHT